MVSDAGEEAEWSGLRESGVHGARADHAVLVLLLVAAGSGLGLLLGDRDGLLTTWCIGPTGSITDQER